MFSGIAKFAGTIFNGDSKDKSSDIIGMFFKEREREQTTHNHEIQYRKQVEKLVKDADLYRITFVCLFRVWNFLSEFKLIIVLSAEPQYKEDDCPAHDTRGQYS